jgi:ferritin-like metal-binding protein YciE
MAGKNTIKELLTDEIKDLYSAEKQLTKAIPKMADGSNDRSLKEAFTAHLEETKNQVTRLEQVAEMLAIQPTGKKCFVMEDCIEEGSEALDKHEDGNVLDLGLIGAASRVKHYEIAGYMTAISLAERLGAKAAVSLLNQSLGEEQAAEKKLRGICAGLVKTAPAMAPAS